MFKNCTSLAHITFPFREGKREPTDRTGDRSQSGGSLATRTWPNEDGLTRSGDAQLCGRPLLPISPFLLASLTHSLPLPLPDRIYIYEEEEEEEETVPLSQSKPIFTRLQQGRPRRLLNCIFEYSGHCLCHRWSVLQASRGN